MEFYRKQTEQDSDFVRWSSAFHLCIQSRKVVSCLLISLSIRGKNIFSLPAGNYKAQFYLAIKILCVCVFTSILNNSAILPVNTEPQNTQMHCRISPRRKCNTCGCTMKISCRYQSFFYLCSKNNH